MIPLLTELEAIALVVARNISPLRGENLAREYQRLNPPPRCGYPVRQYPFSAVFLFSAFSPSESLEP
jgi:hypothetical protein